MKIEHDIQAAALCRIHRPSDPLYTVIHELSNIVVYRKPYMIGSPRCYGLKVLLSYKSVESFRTVVTLRHPPSQIDAFVKTFFLKHFAPLSCPKV